MAEYTPAWSASVTEDNMHVGPLESIGRYLRLVIGDNVVLPDVAMFTDTLAEAENITALIAAAPDLYEALKELLTKHNLFSGPATEKAKAALAKAEPDAT